MKDSKATVRLAEQTLRAFKSKTAQQGLTIQEVLETAVEAFLGAKNGKFEAE